MKDADDGPNFRTSRVFNQVSERTIRVVLLSSPSCLPTLLNETSLRTKAYLEKHTS